jgi:diguanylate cyclase (GGDEF)-like protein/PAS domain S-box-containing protein
VRGHEAKNPQERTFGRPARDGDRNPPRAGRAIWPRLRAFPAVNPIARTFRAVSLRNQLVVLLLAVETVALAFLVWQGWLMDLQRSESDFQAHVAQVRPLLAGTVAPAALSANGDALVATLREARTRGIEYLVVKDATGRILGAEGWDPARALPRIDASLESAMDDRRYDTIIPLGSPESGAGTLHLGLSVERDLAAISHQLRESAFKAVGAFLISVLFFLVIIQPLARRLQALTNAAQRIEGGDYAIRVGDLALDDVGLLGQAFDRMAEVVRLRVQELEASRQKFHNIADYTYDVECWFGTRGELLWVNSSVERLTGYTSAECFESENFPWPLVHPEDYERVKLESYRALKEHTTGSGFEFRIAKKDGSVEWLTNSWQPIYGPEGDFLGLRSSFNSIQALKNTEIDLRSTLSKLEEANLLQVSTAESLSAERSRLLALLSAMSFGVVFIDRSQRIIYSNPAFAEVWSIPRSSKLVGESLFEVLQAAEDVVTELDAFSKRLGELVADQGASSDAELRLMSGRILRLQVSPVLDSQGLCLGSVLIHEDITLAREAQSQLAFLAERDALTGLYNRRRFERELAERLEGAKRSGERVALFFLDLDEFKSVNDMFGHRMGDTVLLQLAGEIRSSLRKNEFFARIGGDEFALVVSGASDEAIRALADRLMGVVGGYSVQLGEVRLSLTPSLGVALYPEHATDPQDLIAHADAAMYQAKDAGKNTWRVYRPDHTATLRQRSLVTWNDRIRQALRTDGFELHLQGVFGARDRKRRYAEALLRMPDEATGRLLLPSQFIPFAEKSNLIIDVDRWMVEAVIRQLAADPAHGAIAVNVSGRSFDEPEMADFIAECLRHNKVDPSRLYVEITETAAIRDMRDAQRFIDRLHATGCKVSLDDFGAGFCTFAYIKQLPVDVLKIDGLFIRNLARSRDNQVFVKAMLDIARGFGKLTVAEAVEDEQSLDMLANYGVDMVQGFYLESPKAAPATKRSGSSVLALKLGRIPNFGAD